jgi:hypothetical protein
MEWFGNRLYVYGLKIKYKFHFVNPIGRKKRTKELFKLLSGLEE